MAVDKQNLLQKLSLQVDALRRAMDTVMIGNAPDHGKWSAFASYARAYNALATTYVQSTGDQSVRIYNTDKLPSWGDSVWPQQKEVFDTVYADTLILSSCLIGYDVGLTAPTSQIQELLSGNLRRVI